MLPIQAKAQHDAEVQQLQQSAADHEADLLQAHQDQLMQAVKEVGELQAELQAVLEYKQQRVSGQGQRHMAYCILPREQFRSSSEAAQGLPCPDLNHLSSRCTQNPADG